MLGSTKLEITGKIEAGKEIVMASWCTESLQCGILIEDKICHLQLAFPILRAFDFKDPSTKMNNYPNQYVALEPIIAKTKIRHML